MHHNLSSKAKKCPKKNQHGWQMRWTNHSGGIRRLSSSVTALDTWQKMQELTVITNPLGLEQCPRGCCMIMCRCRRFTAEVLRGVNILWILRLIAQNSCHLSACLLVDWFLLCFWLMLGFFGVFFLFVFWYISKSWEDLPWVLSASLHGWGFHSLLGKNPVKHHQKVSATRTNLSQISTQQLLLLVRANASALSPRSNTLWHNWCTDTTSLQGSTLRSNPPFEVKERNARRDIWSLTKTDNKACDYFCSFIWKPEKERDF